jgi:DNA polymerase III subunit delta
MKNLFLIHGNNPYQNAKNLEKILANLKDLDPENIEGKKLELSNFKSDIKTLPFLSDKRLIILNDFFETNEKEEQEKMLNIINEIPDFLILIIKERKSFDKRLSSYKNLKKIAEIYESTELTEKTAPIWLKNYLKENNVKSEIDLAFFLVKHSASFSEFKLINEIEKLKTFANGETITKEMVKKLVPEALSLTIFNLTEAVSNKNKEKAINIIKKMSDSGQDAFYIFNMLIRQFRILLTIKDLKDKGLKQDEIAKKTKLHPYPVSLAIPQCQNFSQETLIRIYQELLKIDIATKSNDIKTSTTDHSELILALEKLIINFCNRE